MNMKRKTTKKPNVHHGLVYEISFGGIGGNSCRRIDQDFIDGMTDRALAALDEAAEQQRKQKAEACAKRIERFTGEELRRLKAGLPSQDEDLAASEKRRREQWEQAAQRDAQSRHDQLADRDRKIEAASAKHKAALSAADTGFWFAERLAAAVKARDWKLVLQISADADDAMKSAAKRIKQAAGESFKDHIYRRVPARGQP